MTHTKGPWKVGRDEFPNEDNIYGPDHIIVGGAHPSRKEVKANARLIAAAPELLEACRQALYILGDITDIDGGTIAYDGSEKFAQEVMRIYETLLPEAIAKAEGR